MNGLTPVSFRKGRGSESRLSEPRVPGRHDPRFWREDEKAVLRERYPIGGAAACLAHLPGRRRGPICQMAAKLGLTAPGQPAERTRRDYGPEMDLRIRQEWPLLKGRGAVDDLAERLDVPRWWLSRRATAMGLSAPHRKEPRWTAAEDDLMRRVPLHNPDVAARMFREHGYRRSATAIVVRAKRLELSRRTHETLSATGCARVLGVDSKTVTAWCIAGDLKAGRRGSRRLVQQGGDAWAIAPSNLRRYILDNIERIDIRKVDKLAFVALIASESDAGTGTEGVVEAPVASDELHPALCARIAELQAENLRLTTLAARSDMSPEQVSLRPARRWTWQDRAKNRGRAS